MRKVVITGMGVLSPVGSDLNSFLNALRNQKSGITMLEDMKDQPVKIGGRIRDIHFASHFSNNELQRLPMFCKLGILAGRQAIVDCGIQSIDSERSGCSIGTGIGGLQEIVTEQVKLSQGGSRKVSPFFAPNILSNSVSSHLSLEFQLKGPQISISTACTTGLHSIGDAFRLIKEDYADFMLAGGTESCISPLGIAAFSQSKALTTNADPEKASRPFDLNRSGFVMSEGAAVLVLEEEEKAKQRKARIYAEISGFGLSGDAFHLTAPSDDGDGAFRCMKDALQRASCHPSEIDYINAHAASTKKGDLIEALAIERMFGTNTPVSSTKGVHGHLLGAAGAVEAIATILSLYHGFLIPNSNLDSPDPSIKINLIRDLKEKRISKAMSNSFGFGGTNASIIFQRHTGCLFQE